jgi:hypothetical protein
MSMTGATWAGRPSESKIRKAIANVPGVITLLLLATSSLYGASLPASLQDTNIVPKLRPARGEIPPTFWEQYGWWVIAGAVALVILAACVAWLLLRPKPPVILPPDTQARRELEPLLRQVEDGRVLSRTSQVLRHYVAKAFGLPPEEMNTTEFCRALAGQERLGAQLSQAISDFVRQCDLRKFAPPPAIPPPIPTAPPVSAVQQALRLVEQAEARRAAVTQSAGQVTSADSSRSGQPR